MKNTAGKRKGRSIGYALLGLWMISQGGALFAREQSEDVNAIYKKAMEARGQKNYPVYLENMLKATAVLPEYPPLRLHLAAAYALNENKAEALRTLGGLVAKGLYLPVEEVEENDAFDSIKDADEFKDLLRRFKDNLTPTEKSDPAFELEEKSLITEGVAYDFRRYRFLISSVHQQKIVQRDREGEISDFSSPDDGLWAVMGMKIDKKGRTLWACTAGIPQQAALKESDNGRTGVFQYDLESGKLVNKFIFPDKDHLFGDLTIHPSGDIYVSDSAQPAVYRLSPGKQSGWETYLKGEPFLNLQGLDFAPDGKRLFVADYLRGIYVVEPDSRKLSLLVAPEDASLVGIDGLYFTDNSLIAVQNGITPHRVIRIFLDATGKKITRVKILENNHRLFNEPTLGVVVKKTFYYVANSQWNAFNEKGELAAEDKLQRPVILSLKIR